MMNISRRHASRKVNMLSRSENLKSSQIIGSVTSSWCNRLNPVVDIRDRLQYELSRRVLSI